VELINCEECCSVAMVSRRPFTVTTVAIAIECVTLRGVSVFVGA